MLGIQFRHVDREVETESGWIDILAEPYGSKSDPVVIESQIGELNDDHISRGHKYAIEQEATVLIYLADDFSSITRQQLTRIGESGDQIYIFGLSPLITYSDDAKVTMGFIYAISPSDWEDYRDRNFPSGLDEDRTIIFDRLSEELEKGNLAKLNRGKPVPTHSGYYESEPDPFGEYEIYYSVRQHVSKEADNGDNIENITLNLRLDNSEQERVATMVEKMRKY